MYDVVGRAQGEEARRKQTGRPGQIEQIVVIRILDTHRPRGAAGICELQVKDHLEVAVPIVDGRTDSIGAFHEETFVFESDAGRKRPQPGLGKIKIIGETG